MLHNWYNILKFIKIQSTDLGKTLINLILKFKVLKLFDIQ